MRTILFSFLSIALVLHTGCGGGDSGRRADMPKVYPVKITIKQDGTALQDASVTLTAETPSKYGSSGITDASGVAVIRTYGFAGAPEGTYTITVSKQGVEGATEAKDAEGNTYQTGGKVYEYVDAKYRQADTSDLNMEVTTKGATAEFDVGAPVHVFISDN